MVATTLDPTRTRTGYFYVWMAAACAVVAFGGFAGTYWLQLIPGTFVGGPLLHLHGALFSAWTLLLLSQTWLAANDRLEHHRAWGLVGVSLATAMVLVGLATAINNTATRVDHGYGDAGRAFLIVPATSVVFFGVAFATAVANINRPEVHKRLVILATVSLLQAAMARVFFLVNTGGGPGARPGLGPPQPVAATVPAGLIVDLLLVAAIVYDWRTRGRPHPVYLIGGGALVALQLLRAPLAATPQWLATAEMLTSFAR